VICISRRKSSVVPKASNHVKPMDLKAVDLNLLKAFDALMTERAVTRAGQRIGLSQPAMSGALLRLRELFSDPLFIRTQTGMEPTLRATELAVPVQDALRLIQEALKTTSNFDPITTQRTFVIGMTEYAEIGLMRQLSALFQHHIQVRIHIRAMTKVEYIPALDEGAVDLFVGHADHLPPRFNSTQLLEDPLVLMVRRKHAIFKDGVSYDSLVKWPHVLVSPSGDAQGVVDEYLSRENKRRQIALTVATYLAVPLALEQSDLMASVPEKLSNHIYKGEDLITTALPFQHVVRSTMVWHGRTNKDPAHTWLRRTILASAHSTVGAS
jgi:DNA-binding transcriptional LysR family regulator